MPRPPAARRPPHSAAQRPPWRVRSFAVTVEATSAAHAATSAAYALTPRALYSTMSLPAFATRLTAVYEGCFMNMPTAFKSGEGIAPGANVKDMLG